MSTASPNNQQQHEEEELHVDDQNDADYEEGEDEQYDKHMLEHEWTLWFDNPAPRSKTTEKNYLASLQPVISFASAEEFWSVFNYVVKPRELRTGTTYRLMKTNVGTPQWENEACKFGGEWILSIKADSVHLKQVDELWKFLCLACIGEAFDNSEFLLGANAAVRKSETKISIWIGTCKDDIARRFGEQFRQFLSLPPELQVHFKAFEDAIASKYESRIVL